MHHVHLILKVVKVAMSFSGSAYPHLPTAGALHSQSFERPHVNVTQCDISQLVSPSETIPADASGFIQWAEDLMEQNSEVSVPRRAKPLRAISPRLPPCLCCCHNTLEPDVVLETQRFDKESLAGEQTRQDKCRMLTWPPHLTLPRI